MQDIGKDTKKGNRRTFLQRGVTATAAATAAGMVIPGRLFAQNDNQDEGNLTRGDIAILQFLSAAEQVETDLWQQYSELGGTQDAEVSGVNGGNPIYTAALQLLDGDMDQYVHDSRTRACGVTQAQTFEFCLRPLARILATNGKRRTYFLAVNLRLSTAFANSCRKAGREG